MTLDAIRDVRRNGQRPGLALVVIGDGDPLPMDEFRIVQVRSTDNPARMDWRPLIGVPVALFTVGRQPQRTIAVLDAMKAAGALLVGFADAAGIVADSEEMEAPLRRARELLCLS